MKVVCVFRRLRRAKGPCKRTQHCWPTTPNIVGPSNVVTCCDARLHGTTRMLALVAYSLKPVKFLGPCKRTQHCWPTTPNNVGSCWHLLALVASVCRGLNTRIVSYSSDLTDEKRPYISTLVTLI